MWVQDCYGKGIPMDSVYCDPEMKSVDGNLQQKGGEGSEKGRVNAWEGQFDHLRKTLA